jgi:hypothetical protein
VTSIGGDAFGYCTSLTNITIPDSVTGIGSYLFYSCTSLTNFTIPNSVSIIGDYAFDGCYSLISITIPNSVTSIGSAAFAGCARLTSVTIPDSVSNIADWVFSDCTRLTNITIPDSVTSIGDGAFDDCTSLTSITIPNSVTGIGYESFADSTSLKGIFFNGDAPSLVGSDVFYNTPDATAYYLPGTTGWSDFATNADIPTAPWLPAMLTSDGNFGVQTNQFGFNISWASGKTVVVEACTNLSSPDWQPVQTNTLTTGSAHFSDPQWTNYPGGFYRLRSP